MILEMLKDQNYPDLNDFSIRNLPKIGYVALMGKNAIAAGFLRRIEGDIMAQIDSLVSNPYFGSIVRHKGISMVIDRLITDAKDLKIKGIYALTIDKSIINRAVDTGFHAIDHSVVVLPLKE